jgi:hypothetical protein
LLNNKIANIMNAEEEKQNVANKEESDLNIEELMNVEGGIDDDGKGACGGGLGCFVGTGSGEEPTD